VASQRQVGRVLVPCLHSPLESVGACEHTMTPDESKRFWAKVNKNGPVPSHRPELGPCWLWTAAKTPRGYGLFWSGDKRLVQAHRFAYGAKDGERLDHLCRTSACIRKTHLEPTTNYENLLRGNTLVSRNLAKTHCPKGHPYDAVNTRWRVSRYGRKWRDCRICTRIANRKRKAT
jgi:hypothetical protein